MSPAPRHGKRHLWDHTYHASCRRGCGWERHKYGTTYSYERSNHGHEQSRRAPPCDERPWCTGCEAFGHILSPECPSVEAMRRV